MSRVGPDRGCERAGTCPIIRVPDGGSIVRSRWWGWLFWLALIGVLIVPSSGAPEPAHRRAAVGVLLLSPLESLGARQAILYVGSGLPVCGAPDAYDRLSCLRDEDGMRQRATVNPRDAEAALGEATTVKWLLTNTDSRTATLPASADEVRQRLLRAGYRLVVARTANSYDPVPAGTIVHAIPFGTACLIGFQHTWDHVDGYNVMGTLPGGGCLPP